MQRVLVASMMALLVALSGCSRSAAPEASERPEALGDAIRYLSLGDSLTQGVGAPDEQTGSFPALLAEKWRGRAARSSCRTPESAATPRVRF
jgi:lysophospholipase L1-like esterase